MKIVLATDGSDFNKAAIAEFAFLPFPAGTQILVVSAYTHSTPMMSFAAPMGTLVNYYEQIDSAAKKYAEDAVEKTAAIIREKNAHVIITTKAIEGSAKQAILEASGTFEADLIVVGSHGHGSLERFLLGSVSQAVSLYAKCSVAIVRSRNGVAENR